MAKATVRVVPNAKGLAMIKTATEKTIETVANEIAEDASSNAPVDTGRLSRSMEVEADGDTATITARTPYSAYVELGTSRSAAQPFLKPAAYTKRSGKGGGS